MASARTSSGWHRRVIRKVFRSKKADPLNMLVATEEESSFATSLEYLHVSPEAPLFHPPMLQQSPLPLLEMINDSSALISTSESPPAAAETKNPVERRGSPLTRISRAVFQSELTKRLDRWSRGQNENLQVKCEPTGNALQLLRGQANFNATINLDHIVFGNIQFSGGQLEAHNFSINLLSSTPPRRYPNQFDLLGQNLTFTQADLYQSSCIRNGLRRLLTRIFQNRGLTVIAHNLKSIRILPSGKISCIGQAAPLFGPIIPFEVRSGIEVLSGSPNILSFPGLEISVNPLFGIFVPVIPDHCRYGAQRRIVGCCD